MERLSEREKEEIARLAAAGLPSRLIGQQIGRHHRTVWGHIARLRRPLVPEPMRSPLRCRSLNARRSRGGWPVASRCGRSRGGWTGLHRRSRARSQRTVDGGDIGRVRRTRLRCGVLVVRSGRSSRRVLGSELLSRGSSELRWSPAQISGWLVEEFPDEPEMRVSHETIYLSLFVQSRGALRKELTRYLRSGHTNRRPRGHTVMNGQGQLRATLNIRDRKSVV